MRADLFDIPIGDVTYRAEEPVLKDGLRVTLTVLDADNTPRHADRVNLDRASTRQRYAETAGVPVLDLLTVRTTLLAQLTPPASEEVVGAAAGIAEDDAAALALLDAPDLMERMVTTVGALGYAGDDRPLRVVYLALVSRLQPRPINLVFSGPSAAGKTFTFTCVTQLCPPEATYFLSGMSDRVLAYTDADLRNTILILGESSAIQRDGIGASLLRNLAWEGRLVYETVERTAEGIKPRRIEKPGPTGFITTTTGRVEPELETRTLTIPVDDSAQATRTIIASQARHANGHAPDPPDLAPWHAAQRWLAAHGEREVTIPFAEPLGARIPARQVRARRDFPQLLALIKAHAILFQRQRARDGRGRIVADERDYRAIYALAGPIFGAIAAEGVTPAIRETVEAVKKARGIADEPVSVTKLAELLDLDKATVSRRVNLCIKGGWLVNTEERKGRPAKIIAGEKPPEDRPALPAPGDVFHSPPDATVQRAGVLDDSLNAANENGVALRVADRCADDDASNTSQHTAQQSFAKPGEGNDSIVDGCCAVAPEDETPLLSRPETPKGSDDADWRRYRQELAAFWAAQREGKRSA